MLSKADLERVEIRLLEERNRALEVIADFDEEFALSLKDVSGDLSAYRLHPADIGSESMEREQRFLVASQEGDRLYRIDRALTRIYDREESFGQCTSCGNAIPIERMIMVPESDLCADCQAGREEKE